MRVRLTKPLPYAYGGVRVVVHPPGEYEIGAGDGKLSQHVADVAVAHHGAERVDGRRKRK